MPKLEVRGRCHPPPYTDPKYKGWTIKASEVERVMPKYVGKPVYIEHDTSVRPSGKVKSVFRDKKTGALLVDLAINEDNDGLELMKKIHSGELGELSISYNAHGDPKTKARTSEPEPIEISICKKGAMEDTLIFGIKVDDMAVVSSQKSQSVYTLPPVSIQNSNKMSTEEQTNVPTTSAVEADPLARYSRDEIVRKVKLAEEVESKKMDELKEALANFIAPAWSKVKLENPADDIPDIGLVMEDMLKSKEGRKMIDITAKLSGNFLKFEHMYLEQQETIKKLEDEKKTLEASMKPLVSEDERKTPFSGMIAPLFASINNSASAADEPAHKKMRIADMFGGGNTAAMMGDIRNNLSSGKMQRPDSIKFPGM